METGTGPTAAQIFFTPTNAEGRVYRMSYDAQGRMLSATNSAGERVVRNIYDAVGYLTSREDGAGRVTQYQYDALNRRVETLYSDGTWEGFGYDAVGNLTSASNSLQSTAYSLLTFDYDAMDRLASSETRVAGQVLGVGYGYDLGGLCTNVVYPDGKAVRYAYDLDGRVTNVTDWAGRSFAFTRDAAGRLTALSYPNGVAGAWTHDANHAVSSWGYNNGSPIIGRTITRDEAGVKTKEQVTAGLFPNPQSPRRSSNVFDAADRLVSATATLGTNTVAEAYLYDGCGALTNRLSVSGDAQYEYDCAGRMTFASSGDGTLSVTYDALGNRVTTYAANNTRIWITDHADPRKRPLMEADSNGVPVRYFIWGGGMLLAVVEADGVVHYAHSDDQGSVIALTDASGAVTDQYCYGPYGTDWGHTGTNSIPFRWLGSHGVFNVGGSALHLTRFRAYDASMGRFLSSDPLGLGGGPNVYAYCMSNPLAYIDPLGLCGESSPWYDQLASYMADQVATSKDIVNGSSVPWVLAGTINTAMDMGLGLASYPSAFMHMGEAAGAYSVDPTLENLAGVYSDIALAAGTAATVLSFVPSANVPLGVKPVVPAESVAAESVAIPSRAPDFVVTPNGEAIPVPSGATGPTPTRAPGFQYTGGSGGHGLDSRTTGVRIMDGNANQGPRAVYMNQQGQTVNPATGRTVPNSNSTAHHYLDPWE